MLWWQEGQRTAAVAVPAGAVEGTMHQTRSVAPPTEGLPGDALHPRLDGWDQGNLSSCISKCWHLTSETSILLITKLLGWFGYSAHNGEQWSVGCYMRYLLLHVAVLFVVGASAVRGLWQASDGCGRSAAETQPPGVWHQGGWRASQNHQWTGREVCRRWLSRGWRCVLLGVL